MSERLILRGGTGPFQVLAPNSNPVPLFNDLLFDGDAGSLQILMQGQVSIPATTLTGNWPDWTQASYVTVLFGKTFTAPPMCVVGTFNNDGGVLLPWSLFHQTNLQNGPTYTHDGTGIATATDRCYLWNQSIRSVTTRYRVYDRAMG